MGCNQVISDGQQTIREAVARQLPGVPHSWCQFHYLRGAAKPIFEADRHAKAQLKHQVRGIRSLERALEGNFDEQVSAIHGYCLAVRSAFTDDGRPPCGTAGFGTTRGNDRFDRPRSGAASDGADLILWLFWHGVMPLYTPLGGLWLDMAESVQRILVRRALTGHHPKNPQQLIDWFEQMVAGWNQEPTPFVWNGKRRRRRERARLRRLGRSAAAVVKGYSIVR